MALIIEHYLQMLDGSRLPSEIKGSHWIEGIKWAILTTHLSVSLTGGGGELSSLNNCSEQFITMCLGNRLYLHLPGIKQLSLHKIMTCVSMCSGLVHDHCTTIVLSQSKSPLLSIHILPDDMGMLYLSECRLLMAPTLGTLAGVITEGPWVIGVTGAVGVVGVWGKLCGDVSNMFFDMVTLDTRFSCKGPRRKGREKVETREKDLKRFDKWEWIHFYSCVATNKPQKEAANLN